MLAIAIIKGMLVFILTQSCISAKHTDQVEFSVASSEEQEGAYGQSIALVPAELESTGPITCENPGVRDEEPMYLASFGYEWDNQRAQGHVSPSGHWIGGSGVIVEDFNQDNRLDVYAPSSERNLIFFQQEDGSFSEESQTALTFDNDTIGVVTTGGSVADFDGDDDLDLFILNLNAPYQLLENVGGGVFVDRASDLGLVQDSYNYHSVIWGDPDHDGDLDPFVLTASRGAIIPTAQNETEHLEPAGPNRLYRNNDGSDFTLERLDNHTPEPHSCCGAFVDVNLDYKQDLYIVNDYGMHVQPNQVFLNDGQGDLTPDFGSGLDIEIYGMGLALGTLNDDDVPDFAVTDWNKTWLLLSDGFGGWYDAGHQYDLISDQGNQTVAWGVELPDVDNDGDLDIWVGYGPIALDDEEEAAFSDMGFYNPRHQPDSLFLQEDGQLIDVADVWGINRDTITRGGVWADLNNDGFLDLIVSAIDGPVQAYLANCDDSSWIRIQLRQPDTMNTRAVGARVKVTTEAGRQLRWILAGASLSSSGPMEAHFGLGDADTIREIQIIWPDATQSILNDVEVNRIVTVTRLPE